jgi:3-oxoacyl-[acyl-carrier-protein] synthase II
MNKRTVITGLGAITALGNDVSTTWEGIKAGKSGIGHITLFDPQHHTTRYAAEIKDFDPKEKLGKESRKMCRFAHLAVHASLEAMEDAGLKEGGIDPSRLGVIQGNGIGGFEGIEQFMRVFFENGPERVPIMAIPKIISNMAPGYTAIFLRARGPVYTIVTACSAGTDAIGAAQRCIEKGICDVVVTGGVEAAVTPFGVASFNVLRALSTKFNQNPEAASRPFDKNRDGFVLGEGAGILILEELEHAKARGARIYAELAGYGTSCDAYHITAPHPDGVGAVAAMRMALADAQMSGEEIDYVNAHGTSTPLNDPTETAAIKKVLGDHAYKIKVSSTKSMIGHCIGGAGGIEALVCIKAMEEGVFPPTINLDEPDDGCDLDYVPNKMQRGEIKVAMSNSLGFGGHNGIVIFKKYE